MSEAEGSAGKDRKEPVLELTAREVAPQIKGNTRREGVADAAPDLDEPREQSFRGIWIVAIAIAGVLVGSFATSALGVFGSAKSGLASTTSGSAAAPAAPSSEIAALRASIENLAKSSEERLAALDRRLKQIEGEPAAAASKASPASTGTRAERTSGEGPSPYTPPSGSDAAVKPAAKPKASDSTSSRAENSSAGQLQPLPTPETNVAAVPPPPANEPRVVRSDELSSSRGEPPRPGASIPGQRNLAGRDVLRNWSVIDVRGGRAIIDGGMGAYEVQPGSFHPELGMVESIDWRGDRWIVVTERGIIDSARR